MNQQESDRVQFVVRKLLDLKLQIHRIEKEGDFKEKKLRAILKYRIGHWISRKSGCE